MVPAADLVCALGVGPLQQCVIEHIGRLRRRVILLRAQLPVQLHQMLLDWHGLVLGGVECINLLAVEGFHDNLAGRLVPDDPTRSFICHTLALRRPNALARIERGLLSTAQAAVGARHRQIVLHRCAGGIW